MTSLQAHSKSVFSPQDHNPALGQQDGASQTSHTVSGKLCVWEKVSILVVVKMKCPVHRCTIFLVLHPLFCLSFLNR